MHECEASRESQSLGNVIETENALIIKRGGISNIREGDAELNDLQRGKITAVFREHRKAYLFSINGPKGREEDPNKFYTEYTGQQMCNFCGNYVVPVRDESIQSMVNQWRKERCVELLEKIEKQVQKMGGTSLFWS